jgi:hypothetical protein
MSRLGAPGPASIAGIFFAVAMVVFIGVSLRVAYSLGVFSYQIVVESGTGISVFEKRRITHPAVSFERRGLEFECTSIPECEPVIEATIVEIKVAKLGGKEQDPKKLPELQKYEEPEKVEVGVNVDVETKKVKPLPFKDFVRRKAQMDRRKRRKKNPFLDVMDDDKRKRPTSFERITGRLDGDVMGEGTEQDKRDSYLARASFELHKACEVPASIPLRRLKRQVVEIVVQKMSMDGSILKYRVRRRARMKTFTLAVEATIRHFMPSEGGALRLPSPDPETLAFINKRGFIVEINGRLFKQF